MPIDSANLAFSRAEAITASHITSSNDFGIFKLLFVSNLSASSSWSRLPQLTPILTGLSNLQAASIIVVKFLSFLFFFPTLPGFILNLSKCAASL